MCLTLSSQGPAGYPLVTGVSPRKLPTPKDSDTLCASRTAPDGSKEDGRTTPNGSKRRGRASGGRDNENDAGDSDAHSDMDQKDNDDNNESKSGKHSDHHGDFEENEDDDGDDARKNEMDGSEKPRRHCSRDDLDDTQAHGHTHHGHGVVVASLTPTKKKSMHRDSHHKNSNSTGTSNNKGRRDSNNDDDHNRDHRDSRGADQLESESESEDGDHQNAAQKRTRKGREKCVHRDDDGEASHSNMRLDGGDDDDGNDDDDNDDDDLSDDSYLRNRRAREEEDDDWEPNHDEDGDECARGSHRKHGKFSSTSSNYSSKACTSPRKRGRPSKAEELETDREWRSRRDDDDACNRGRGAIVADARKQYVRANRWYHQQHTRLSPSPPPPARAGGRGIGKHGRTHPTLMSAAECGPESESSDYVFEIPMEGRVWETPKGFARSGGDWLKGRCIRVFWDAEDQWFPGIVGAYDARRDAEDSHGNKGPVHEVFYEDGAYLENLHHARWQFDINEGAALRPKTKRKSDTTMHTHHPAYHAAKKSKYSPVGAFVHKNKTSTVAVGGRYPHAHSHSSGLISSGLTNRHTSSAVTTSDVVMPLTSAAGWKPFEFDWMISALRREVDALTGKEMEIEWKCSERKGTPEWRPDAVVKHEALFKMKLVE
jgi:hypothetical protein